MKHYRILKETQNTYEDIADWVSKNCIGGYAPTINYDLDCISGSNIRISTQDSFLPYQILSCDNLYVSAPNLETTDNFPIHSLYNTIINFTFVQTSKLDFSDFCTHVAFDIGNITFTDIPALHPQILQHVKVNILSVNACGSPHFFDINNYKSVNIKNVVIQEPRILGLQNVSTFFDTPLEIQEFKINTSGILNSKEERRYDGFNDVMNKYFNNKSFSERSNYAMDATLEFIENDLEDIL